MVGLDIDMPDKCEHCAAYMDESYNDDPNDDPHCFLSGIGIPAIYTGRPSWCPLVDLQF